MWKKDINYISNKKLLLWYQFYPLAINFKLNYFTNSNIMIHDIFGYIYKNKIPRNKWKKTLAYKLCVEIK